MLPERKIDIAFNVQSDARGGDPDKTSPTLRQYHKYLWSKPLPSGSVFELSDKKSGSYLYHSSNLGDFYLGSDAITHSYKNQQRKRWLTKQIPDDVNELFQVGSTIGAYILFPNKRFDGNQTINQARGINKFIDDRFDLTLECIRRFYLGESSPLYDTLLVYKEFFDLFDNFAGYVQFFLLDDLVDDSGQVKFYLPFDDFKTPPKFSNISDYLEYKKKAVDFVKSRNRRIDSCVNS